MNCFIYILVWAACKLQCSNNYLFLCFYSQYCKGILGKCLNCKSIFHD